MRKHAKRGQHMTMSDNLRHFQNSAFFFFRVIHDSNVNTHYMIHVASINGCTVYAVL